MAISLKSLLKEAESSIEGKKPLPPLPSLTPEQERATIDEYRRLSPSDKKVVQQLLKVTCAWCEVELQIHNVGASHGMCGRHYVEFVGGDPKTIQKGSAPDLKEIDPKLLHLSERLWKMISDRKNKKRSSL